MSPDPTRIAGYRVIRRIGRGGMSTVYLAEHLHLHRRVALKVLDPEFASTPTFRTRFARESQIVAELEHPHIVPVYDAGEADGLLFLVMRFVEQGDLRDLLAAGEPLHHDRLRVLVDQLAGALGVAHDAGLVHRDIKPANVLFSTGPRGGDHYYLSDFGITKRATAGPPLTATGQVLGSVDFIAPEQIAGRPLDRRTDVYAFGGLVYQCLTGHLPFERDHELAVLLAHVREDPLPPSTHRPELSPAVDAVLARVLAKDPDARPDTARDFADELVAALDAAPLPAPAPTAPAPTAPDLSVPDDADDPGTDPPEADDTEADDTESRTAESGTAVATSEVPVDEAGADTAEGDGDTADGDTPDEEAPTTPVDAPAAEPRTERMPVPDRPSRPAAPGPVTTFAPPPTDAPPATGNPRPAPAAPGGPRDERRWIVLLAVLAALLIAATVVVALAGAR
ncbi:hypothetical protein GCM10017691_44600 [Pseudonocardia petroleophila]|uniref:non-specific serine/threonine protein kinase n=1 Tax=Pseudonocardia petroleophila TaxID=37331 RepID=A0A7G7MAS4_9PSEU|nr:serine/threonine-protein kinase [Pseudonocardia petroleophila]QNG49885.1 protein kinase [Pseudonocardia petroleophila]